MHFTLATPSGQNIHWEYKLISRLSLKASEPRVWTLFSIDRSGRVMSDHFGYLVFVKRGSNNHGQMCIAKKACRVPSFLSGSLLSLFTQLTVTLFFKQVFEERLPWHILWTGINTFAFTTCHMVDLMHTEILSKLKRGLTLGIFMNVLTEVFQLNHLLTVLWLLLGMYF